MYLRWRRAMSPSIEIIPVELPGRGARVAEEPVVDFNALVADLCDEQADVLGRRPALFGHSMGALLAYGIALRQRALGRPQPRMLFVSGSAAPRHREHRLLATRPDDAALIDDLRRQGGTPEAVLENAELLRLTLDTLRADYRVCDSYVWWREAPLDLPVCALGGRADTVDTEALMAWRSETTQGFSLHWFEGGHFFVKQDEQAVLRTLERELASTARHGPFADDHAPARVA